MKDRTMIQRLCVTTVAFAMLFFVAGCSSSSGDRKFDAKVASLQAGTPKSVVQRELGKPDERQSAVAGANPTQASPQTVNVGSRFETWTYFRGTRQFDIVMGKAAAHPGQWVVHSVSNQRRVQ